MQNHPLKCRIAFREVRRKLLLALEQHETTTDRRDRDVVCGEVFADVTGRLNAGLQAELGFARWYEALASYLEEDEEAADELLSIFKRLGGQPFAAPIFSLLFHRWLLSKEKSLKHLGIMIAGCRQLFLGDVDAGTTAFGPLHAYITAHVVPRYERPLEDESEYSSIGSNPFTDPDHRLLGLCAAFLPYYCDDDGSFLAVIDRIAAAGQRTNPQEPQEPQEPQGQQPPPGQRLHFSAVDFAVGRAVDALSNDVRSDAATAQYLRRLASLKSHVKGLRLSTRIRLQGVLYSFAQPGGPRYASKGVNRLAFRTLDELFPHGKRTRRAINFGFRGLFVFSKLTGAVYYAYIRTWLFFFTMFRAVVKAFRRATARRRPGAAKVSGGRSKRWFGRRDGSASNG